MAKKDNNILTQPKAFMPHLLMANKHNIRLTISIKGCSERFASSILGVYTDHGLLVLDELIPRQGHKLLLQEKQFTAEGFLDGAQLRFSSTLVGEGKSKSGIVYYKVKIPESVFYHQRRESYRVTLTGSGVPFRAQYGDDGQKLSGYASDMSMGGMGVVLAQRVSLETGTVIEGCKASLPGEGDIGFSLKICFAQINEQQKHTRVGGEFVELAPADREKLQRAIIEVQREQARRQRGA
jgi:c-di-GMP-binding flagellar brake protein YcgR